MTDDERLQGIKDRIERQMRLKEEWVTEYDDNVTISAYVGIDPDIPYLLEQLEASQQQVAELEAERDHERDAKLTVAEADKSYITYVRAERDKLQAEVYAMHQACQAHESEYITDFPGWIGRKVAELEAENGRLRMRAEVGRSNCPYCGGDEYHLSECEMEGGRP